MLKKLTLKQRRFINGYIENKGNGTFAALDSYDVKNHNTAHAIASENLRKPTIREAIEEALRSNGLSVDVIAGNIGELANSKPEKISGDVVLKANVELLKLSGAYPDKKSFQFSYSVKQHLLSLSIDELKKETERIDAELNKLLK